jgi:hypothetical protein
MQIISFTVMSSSVLTNFSFMTIRCPWFFSRPVFVILCKGPETYNQCCSCARVVKGGALLFKLVPGWSPVGHEIQSYILISDLWCGRVSLFTHANFVSCLPSSSAFWVFGYLTTLTLTILYNDRWVMTMGQLVEWELAEETETLAEKNCSNAAF